MRASILLLACFFVSTSAFSKSPRSYDPSDDALDIQIRKDINETALELLKTAPSLKPAVDLLIPSKPPSGASYTYEFVGLNAPLDSRTSAARWVVSKPKPVLKVFRDGWANLREQDHKEDRESYVLAILIKLMPKPMSLIAATPELTELIIKRKLELFTSFSKMNSNDYQMLLKDLPLGTRILVRPNIDSVNTYGICYWEGPKKIANSNTSSSYVVMSIITQDGYISLNDFQTLIYCVRDHATLDDFYSSFGSQIDLQIPIL